MTFLVHAGHNIELVPITGLEKESNVSTNQQPPAEKGPNDASTSGTKDEIADEFENGPSRSSKTENVARHRSNEKTTALAKVAIKNETKEELGNMNSGGRTVFSWDAISNDGQVADASHNSWF